MNSISATISHWIMHQTISAKQIIIQIIASIFSIGIK